ncbi:hypothetical protein BDF14DRAFT_1910832 [Spinellus fusiger]|nr:hypothetical protein BDF14DRAFT_1910832 [Spinellus fusiger]
MSGKLQDVMVCTQIFVNYYILFQNEQPVDNKIYTQNFWYSVAQLVLNKTVTNRINMIHNLIVYWESFSVRYPQVIYDGHMDPGYSQCLSAACVEMATAYTNMVVECFESRVKNYLFYSVKILFEEVKYIYMQI